MEATQGGRLTPAGGRTGHEHTLDGLVDVEVGGAVNDDYLGYLDGTWVARHVEQVTLPDVIVMPNPVFTAGGLGASNVSSGAWASLPGGALSISLTVPVATWVLIEYSAWLSGTFTSSDDLRVGVNLTGATVQGEAYTAADGYSQWGNILLAANQSGSTQHAAVRLAKLAAGTTTVELRAYITASPTTPRVNYPNLSVTPIMFDTSVGGGGIVGATGPTGASGPTGPAGASGPTGPAGGANIDGGTVDTNYTSVVPVDGGTP